MSAPTYWSQPNQQVVRNGDPVAAGTNDPDPEVVAAADEGGDTFDPSAHTVAEVNDYLDAVLDGPPPPAWAQTALELETLALYRAQGGTDPFATVPTVRDALVGGPAVAALVGAHKARWGIG
jgi:hypothetical protein